MQKKKTRKEKIAEQQNIKKKEKSAFDKRELLINLLLLVGLLLTIFEIVIYRKTIIKWQFLFLIWLLIGVISSIFFFKFWKENVKDEFGNSSKLLTLFYNCVTFGGITVYVLMLVNFKSPEINVETYKLEILRKSTMSGHNSTRIPIADIEYKGLIKTIVFTPREKKKLDGAKYITLKTKRGNLGYDVIVEKEMSE